MRQFIVCIISIVLLSSCQVSYTYQAREEVVCPINLGLTVDGNADRLNPQLFSPSDFTTYTHAASITVNDIVGIQRLVTLYFIAANDAEQSWYTYLSIDAEQLDILNGELAANDYRAGQLFFAPSGSLARTNPDRFRSPQLIFEDNQYEHQFIVTINPTTTVIGSEYAVSVGVPGCELR